MDTSRAFQAICRRCFSVLSSIHAWRAVASPAFALSLALISTAQATPPAGGRSPAAAVVTNSEPAPLLSMSYVPSSVRVGGTSQMVITLSALGPNAVSGVQFADIYPVGGIVNAPSGVVVTNTCGSVTADPGAGSFTLTQGVIPGFGGCTIIINVVGAAEGTWHNATGQVTSENADTGSGGDAFLTATNEPLLAAPTAAVSFTPASVPVGVLSQMTITLANPSSEAIVGAQINDSYPNGLANNPSGVAIVGDTCGFILADVPQGGNSAKLAGGTIPPAGECSVVIRVAALFTVINQISSVPSASAQTGGPASATLTVLFDPDMTLTKSHAGNFSDGQIGATYTLIAKNDGGAATSGTVTVSDALPSSLTATALGGTGWTCDIPTTSCARSDALVPGASYPPIALTVNVAANAPPTVTNTAAVSGGGETDTSNDTASDPTTITTIGVSDLTLTKSHIGNFSRGQIGANYSISVGNIGAVATAGSVSVIDTLPASLTATAMSGTGWNCTLATKICIRQDALASGSSYPPITLTVNVSANAPSTITNTAVVSGGAETNTGNDSASDTATIDIAAPFVATAFEPTSVTVGGTSQMSIALINPNATTAITGVQFTDTYPTHMANAPGAVVVNNTCGGTVTAVPGGSAVSLTNGTIQPNQSCTVRINVVGTSQGVADNHTGVVTSTNAQDGVEATASLNVVAGSLLPAPTMTKAFAPANILVGGSTQMTITLNNANASAIAGAQFTDHYPQGMGEDIYGVLSNTCSGHIDEYPDSFALIDGTIPAQGSCSIIVQMTAAAGNYLNQTSAVPSANALTGGNASAALTVTAGTLLPAPTVSKAFAPSSVSVGGTSQMTITLTNNDPLNAVNGAQIFDSYPAPLSMANAHNGVIASNSCGGTLTAPRDGALMILGNGSIPAGGSCSVVINVVGTVVGTVVNHTGPVMSGNANAGSDASASLTVVGGGAAAQTIAFTSTAPVNATVGGPVYVAQALASSGLPVALTIDSVSDTVCTIDQVSGTVQFIGAGTCTIDANQGGNAAYAPAPQVQQSVAVGAAGGIAQQTIAFTSTAPLNAKVGGSPYLATALATSNLPVVLTIDSSSATVCTIDSNTGSVLFVGPGNCTIDANQGGNPTYAPAPQMQQSFAVNVAGGANSQVITFTSTAPANAKVGDTPYVPVAEATSNQPVVLTIDASSNTICTISEGAVNFVGAGTCTIDANQGGDMNYAPAPQVQQTFTVSAAGGTILQTISFTSSPPANARVGGPAYVAAAHATSNQPVVLTIDSVSDTVCTINADTVQFIGVGTCAIDANQGGNSSYAPAPQEQQSFDVAAAGGATPQTIAFTSTVPANATVGGPTYLATALATPSGLPVVLTVDAAAAGICAINDGTVSFTGTGTCTLDANQGGNSTYAPAAQVQQAFAVATAIVGTPIAVGEEIEVARNATATTLVGNPKAQASVLDNDINGASVVLVSAPMHASLFTFNADGTFVYKNNGDLVVDTFTYKARNSQLVESNVATVTITVGVGLNNHVPYGIGDAIEVASGGTATTLVGDPAPIASVLDNDTDPDANDTLTASTLASPSHGTLLLDGAGTFSYHNDGSDAAASDSFIYQVCDNHGACASSVVTVTIGSGLGDHLPVVVDDAIQTIVFGQATTLVGDLNDPASVLDNDSDPDSGDVLTASLVGNLLNASGDLTLDSDGTFSYSNTDPSATTDSFVYQACDPQGACKAGLVTITIGNDPPDLLPIAMDDAIMIGPNGTTEDLVGDPNAVDSLLDNDTDTGDTLKAYLISAATNGDATVNPDGTFSYTNTNAAPGIDSFQYEACDSFGACVGATVSITIDPTAPTVTCVLPTQVDMVGDAVNFDLSTLFAPPPGKTLSYSTVNAPPPLSIVGSLLSGILDTSGIYMTTLKATTVPGGVSATEDVEFQVLPAGDILLRNGFDDPSSPPPCQ